MKYSLITILSFLVSVSAFAPTIRPSSKSDSALNAEIELSRKGFFSAAAGAAAFGTVFPAIAMDQVNDSTQTEQWETGKASLDRKARYENARTQNNSNFAPIKRLTLERKSPVTRLDLNAPNFEGYKKSYPGLFK